MYTIFTKSKCIYCDKAKELLSNEKITIINCDDFINENKELFLEIMADIIGLRYNTFPMIFKNEKFIGGYSELLAATAF